VPDPLAELKRRLAEIHDLGRAAALLGWDERTMMPPGGADPRAEVLATIARLRHQMFCHDEVGRLLEAARTRLEGEPDREASSPNGAPDRDVALVRIVTRDWEKARRVPAELRAEIAHQTAVAEHAWIKARERSDFAAFLPHLERNVELTRRFADCYSGFPGFDRPYDPLLDEFEPEMGTAEMKRLLGELREGLVPIVQGLPAKDGDEGSCLYGKFPEALQRQLIDELLAELPLPDSGWRLDRTTHPFATSIAPRDIRLTTRYDERYIGTALWSALHEAGHGLYESGIDPALERTPLAKPRSLGLHESQSRLWENWFGRGRPYVERLLPKLDAAFPGQFDGVSAKELYRDANRARRSLIRIEADELTYNLHILIRFELELEIFDGELSLADLPEAWNARYRDYLGLEVPDDAHGVLQDVHWAAGSFGYFPTYSLGNVIAGQLWRAAVRDLPDLDERIARGDFTSLADWLREHVHRHGRILSPTEILDRAGCGPLSVDPLLEYLRGKLSEAAT
jgi:carboxypeptidase Taq